MGSKFNSYAAPATVMEFSPKPDTSHQSILVISCGGRRYNVHHYTYHDPNQANSPVVLSSSLLTHKESMANA